MSTRVGINGFGRIGRLAVRALRDRPDLELVHVNEPFADVATAAHLLEFDTVHGRYGGSVSVNEGELEIDGAAVGYTSIASPGEVPWSAADVDIVLECSGKFRTVELLAPYFDRGVRKVIVAAPVKDDRVLNIVMGCNDHLYDPSVHHVVTAASCTTNCLAPVVKVLHEQIGIERGVITTIHDATNTQVVVDAPHKDLRRARSALELADPDLDRFGDRDHDDLPRTHREAERRRRAGSVAERVAHRRRVHDDPKRHRRGDQRAPPRRRRR